METNDNNQNDAPDVRAKGKRGRPCLPEGANVHGRGADERAARIGRLFVAMNKTKRLEHKTQAGPHFI